MLFELLSDGFSFHDPAIGGWLGMGFAINGKRCAEGRIETPHRLVFETSALRQIIDFEPCEEARSLTVTRCLLNLGDTPLPMPDVSDGLLSGDAAIGTVGLDAYNAVYAHGDNARTERYPDSRPEYPYVRPIPYRPIDLGRGEANTLPALVIGDLRNRNLLVEGDLDQSLFLRYWELGLHGMAASQPDWFIRHYLGRQVSPLGPRPLLLPGEPLAVSTVFYQLCQAEIQDAFVGYIDALQRRHTFAAAASAMRHEAVYCTWNYGTRHLISAPLLATRVRALADNAPGCRWFLIDDGYQQHRQDRNGPLDRLYPEPARRYDRERFPDGMRAMADTIRAAGLRPAIWLSPTVYLDSPLAHENPDWLLQDRSGDPRLIGGQSTWLDLSVKPARDFFVETLDALFADWGFEGIKFDFMTQWFTLERARFREKNGLYWRDWVFREIRRRIGPDGLFMTCIAMSMGNPFPGRYADAYRCGCDIHDGTWPEQIKACRWTLPQVLLEGRRTGLLNMDSAGFGNVPENEQMFRLTWVFITQGIIELGGPVESFDARQWRLWNTLLRHCDRGHRVRCLDERALTGEGLPEILLVAYPAESRMRAAGAKGHVALFNFSDRVKPIGASRVALGIDPADSIVDFWTGEPRPNSAVMLDVLQPHSARLFEIRPAGAVG